MGPQLKEFLSTLKQIDTVVEIGANNGEDSEILFNLFNPSKFIAIEPDPHNIEILKSRLLNRLPILLISAAICDKDSIMDFYLSDAGDCLGSSSSLRKPKEHLRHFPHVKFPKTIQVKTFRLDTVLSELGISKVDFIWMDVQGAELDVLKGCDLNDVHYICTDIFDDGELYEGMCNSTEFIEYLGPNWKLIYRMGVDFVFENLKFGE